MLGKFKARNDAVMAPDRGFTKQLKKLDPEYEVVWDWGSEVWGIWRVPKDKTKKSWHMTTVATKGKGYRELGADVLLHLQKSLFLNEKYSAKQLADYLDEMDNQVMRKKEKTFRDKIKDMALDTRANIHCKIIQVPREFKIGRVVNG